MHCCTSSKWILHFSCIDYKQLSNEYSNDLHNLLAHIYCITGPQSKSWHTILTGFTGTKISSVLPFPAIRTWHKSERYVECMMYSFYFIFLRNIKKNIWRMSFFSIQWISIGSKTLEPQEFSLYGHKCIKFFKFSLSCFTEEQKSCRFGMMIKWWQSLNFWEDYTFRINNTIFFPGL